ncbi:MAG: hypothetical protein GY710_24700 [Desulfobacteraceae bacterium]|nr:hypothetical protein [Desulfobacteraceae bacterium]
MMTQADSPRQYTWTDTISGIDDKLLVRFALPLFSGERQTAVSIEISWLSSPGDVYGVSLKELYGKKKLQYRFLNGLSIDGWIEGVPLRSGRNYEDAGIFGDFHFGRREQFSRYKHFEGVMISFMTDAQPPCPLPPVPCPDILGGEKDIVLPGIIGQTRDLFPYVYMRTWPQITPDDLCLHFVNYEKGPVSPGLLYTKLSAMVHTSPPASRDELKQLAVDYIDGASEWKGQYVPDVSVLPGAIGYFLEMDAYVRNCRESGLEKVIDTIANIVHLPREDWSKYLDSKEYKLYLNRVQDSYFALIITLGYDLLDLRTLSITLVMSHLFEILVKDEVFFKTSDIFCTMARATIILPGDVFPLVSTPSLFLSPPDVPAGWIEPYAIGDLQLARQCLVRYETGEIANIVNIMQGERKEITKRKLNRIDEVTNDTMDQEELINLQDQQQRTNLFTEVMHAVAENKVVTKYDQGTGFTTSYGPPITGSMVGGWQTKVQPEQPSKKDISKFARQIFNKATTNISRKVGRRRLLSLVDESEETVTSIFNNIDNTHGLVGVYRWINKIYQVCVVNYGNRLMVEFMINHPAASYIAQEKQSKGCSFDEPFSPAISGIFSFKKIGRHNYADLCAQYGVTDIQAPPPASRIVSGVLEGPMSKQLIVPVGYLADEARVCCVVNGENQEISIEGLVGSHPFCVRNNTSGGLEHIAMNKEDHMIDIAVMAPGIAGSPPEVMDEFLVTVEVTCLVSETLFSQWQIKIYTAICNGYERQKAVYYQQIGDNNGKESFPQSDLAYRKIEIQQLKQQCLQLLFQRFFELVGRSKNSGEPAQFTVNEPRYMEFFQEIFEWNEMTYQFDEYVHKPGNKRDNLSRLPVMSGADPLFVSFLQAGTARVMVPLRPEKNMAGLYFLSSGMLWSNMDCLAPVNSVNVPIVNELKKIPDQKVLLPVLPDAQDDTWEILVPTTMKILQSGVEQSHLDQLNN